ncbi:MAG: T9SS type A sorting domain-containing protein, partial [Bacteroidetes bacterium]|nr:T9SS type A sorting domain-containing protein [Bacteroidota bacterium]
PVPLLVTMKTNSGTMPAASWSAATTSTVVYDGPSPISAAYPYGNLTYSTVATGPLSGAVNGNLTVNGDLTVNGAGTSGNNVVRGVDVADSSVQRTITVKGNVNLTTKLASIVAVSDPVNAASNMVTASCTWNIGGNVVLSGNYPVNKLSLFANQGTFTGTATYNINGNLVIGSGSQLLYGTQSNTKPYGTGIINLKGNVIQDGGIIMTNSATSGSLTINLDGSSSQSWSGTDSTFGFTYLTLDVAINNAAGVVLGAPRTFNNNTTLTLTNGKVSTDTTNILMLSGTGNISGASDSSYVDGPLALTYSTTGSQTFPIGSATAYRPLTLNATAITGSGTITALQTDANPGGSILPAGVESISKTRYFTITPAAGIKALTGDVTLSWGQDDSVNNLTEVTVVEGTHGGAWTSANNSGGTTGTLSAGTVTGNGFTSFHDFVLGSTSALPAVPTLVSPATNTTSVPRLATFEWSPVTGATKYEFQVATDSSVYTSGDSATAFKIQDVVFDTTVTAPDTSLHLSVPLSTSTKYYWHVSATSTVGTSGYAKPVAFTTGTGLDAIVGEPNEIPREFTLSQNYPNPFNPTTVIQYALPKVEYVQLNVYNVLGQKVASLVSEPQSAGYHVVNFNADRFASGIYFYVIRAGNFAATRKMLFLK